MRQKWKNNAYSTLASALTNVGTTLTVSPGHGDRFPAVSAPDYFILTLQDAANNIEIVKVIERSFGSDSMTIERAQEGTTARAWALGDLVGLRVTAGGLSRMATQADPETLTNKTIDLANNTITGTLAQFNAALSDGEFATIAGAEILTNKTIASPVISNASLTGVPTAPTAPPGTNTTQVATTAFVHNAVGTLGSMSSQNANNVAITGGSITGVAISGGTISGAAITGATISGGSVIATALGSSLWTVAEVGGVLLFRHNGVNKMRLDANGNLTVSGNITAFGAV